MHCKAVSIAATVILAIARSSSAQDALPLAAEATAPAAAPSDQGGWKISWENRPTVRYGDLLRVDFRARVLTDLRRSDASLKDSDTSRFDIARRRIGVSGEIANVADFQVERELDDTRPWRDVYVNYRGLDVLQIQAGQFKLPFGLDENTSSGNLDFVYRSRAAELSPGRDPGVMAHGRAGILRYEAGMFAHDGDNARGNGAVRVYGGRTAAGRLLLQPFRSSTSTSVLEDLQAGVAYTSSEVSPGISDLRVDTALGQPFFPPAFAVQGKRRRAGVEMRWRPGPFSLQSEFIRLTSERRGQRLDNSDLPPLNAHAWYAQGAWALTGERKAKGADEPRRPLFRGGAGSIELAARVEAVRLSSRGGGLPSTGPRAETIPTYRDRVLTLGVNWSPIRWIKVQANLVRDTLSIPARDAIAAEPSTTGAPPSFWSRVLRFQFSM